MAVKLHLVLDHDDYLPSFAYKTDGKVSDVKVAHLLRFEPGTIVVDEWAIMMTNFLEHGRLRESSL